MSLHNQQTAVLLFTNSPELESSRKRLIRNATRNKSLVAQLYQRSREVIKATRLPLIEINEDRQRGDTFGERLHNAFQQAFSEGYERVICVGNDCAELSPRDLINAEEGLHTSDLVIGPDYRGGVFLLGLNRQLFTSTNWESLKWQSAELIPSILKEATQADVHFLIPKFDLNTTEDLSTQLLYSAVLRTLVKNIYKEVYHPSRFISQLKPLASPTHFGLRAPPAH
ncbi:TIGR04282 family arsenosugar biosynthesis glycosyltransferase [Roseivirga sp.]|uniref:TIGR04282 family arsenosugar biosynthesis glycosyltransferase n=1 Tax=Roseivirga sp. TaxID=1964215 RepID=UPI003B51B543